MKEDKRSISTNAAEILDSIAKMPKTMRLQRNSAFPGARKTDFCLRMHP
jgi:hypothetical protein